MRISKWFSLLLVLLIYLFSFYIAYWILNQFLPYGVLLATFLADTGATLLVWLFGILFKNSSFYDPYWSVTPIMILLVWILLSPIDFHLPLGLVTFSLLFWSFRLTGNWILGWKGLQYQDWRYTMLKRRAPKIWQLTNFFGIHFMPTLMVFMAMIPAYFVIFNDSSVNFIHVIGFIFTMTAVFMQIFSDKQMYVFRTNPKNRHLCINIGLWKYSRHPNYLGEILFWWGIWIIQMGVVPHYWFTVIGPLFMTFLFVFISIPLMEQHLLEKRPCYKAYQKEVSMLIPWIPRNS